MLKPVSLVRMSHQQLLDYKAFLDKAPTTAARNARKKFMYARVYSAPRAVLSAQFRNINALERASKS